MDVDRWLLEGPLNPSSALFREDDFLLAQERSLTDRSLYHSVVAAIARGNTSQGAIASALGREQRAVQHPLKALEEAGFVTRTDDMLRSRRPIYRVADPIVRFHHVITRRDLARFEERRTAEAWRDARPRFLTHVLGPHFEDTARDFAFRYAATDTLGGPAVTVGPAVLNDSLARTQHELDVVVLGRDKKGTAPVLALGEAKYTQAKRSPADLTRLEHLRALVAAKDPSAASARLLVFSASGFERNLAGASGAAEGCRAHRLGAALLWKLTTRMRARGSGGEVSGTTVMRQRRVHVRALRGSAGQLASTIRQKALRPTAS